MFLILYDLAHVVVWEPCNLNDLGHLPRFDLHYTDRVQHLTTAG